MAPECLRGETGNTCKSDGKLRTVRISSDPANALSTNILNPCRLVYSFGIVLYELYSRREPYEGDDLYETLEKVSDSTIYHRPGVPNNCPKDIQMIMLDSGCPSDLRSPGMAGTE